MTSAAQREAVYRRALREELVDAWSAFSYAVGTAARVPDPDRMVTWSTMMEDAADRVRRLTRLVGPADPRHVPIPVLTDGWWAAVHRHIGAPVPPIDPETAAIAWRFR